MSNTDTMSPLLAQQEQQLRKQALLLGHRAGFKDKPKRPPWHLRGTGFEEDWLTGWKNGNHRRNQCL